MPEPDPAATKDLGNPTPSSLGNAAASEIVRRVADLASAWEEAKNRGEEITPESLCRESPHLLELLRRQVALHGFLVAATAVGATLPHSPSLEAWKPIKWQPAGYELQAILGRGGMGVVYRARQTGLNRDVALKVIRLGPQAEESALAKFRAEAEAVARLQHPNIVQVYEIAEHEGVPFFTLEYCAGGSLDRWLNGTPLPLSDVAPIVEKLARAVQYAHERGILHRDLKPSNVLLQETAEGAKHLHELTRETMGTIDSPLAPNKHPEYVSFIAEHWNCKIGDFGLAKNMDAPGQTTTVGIVGTPTYMAPEQASGLSSQLGPGVDIYALGVLLYELLTGRPPFVAATITDTLNLIRTAEPTPPSRLNPLVPRDLETICMKCLNKEIHRRYPSAAQLADDLHRFQSQEPIWARPVGSVERAWRWCRRQPGLAAFAASLLAVVVSSVMGLSLLWQRAERQIADARDDAATAIRQKELSESKFVSADSQLRAALKELIFEKAAVKLGNSELAVVEERLRVALASLNSPRTPPSPKSLVEKFPRRPEEAQSPTAPHLALSLPIGSRSANLHLASAKGPGLVNLSKLFSRDENPAWSPDGTLLAFDSDRDLRGNPQIFVMRSNGDQPQQLTYGAASCLRPSWSGDGRRICYMREHYRTPTEMWIMDADGLNQRRIGEGFDPAISSDGVLVAFTSRTADGWRLFTVKVDGTEKRQISTNSNPIGWVLPAWSPDGKRIAWTGAVGQRRHIFAADRDGANEKQLTTGTEEEHSAAWSPDGNKISFYRTSSTEMGRIWVMNADGSEQHQLLPFDLPWELGRTAWRPH